MKQTVKTLAVAMAVAAAASSCSHSGKGWKVEGSFADAGGAPARIALEGLNNGRWYLVDSIDVDNSRFAYTAPQPLAVPDVYRLSSGADAVYFPVDSAETVTIAFNGSSLAAPRTMTGSLSATLMTKADSIIAAGHTSPEAKHALTQIVLDDSVGSVAYYIVNKTIGRTPLYNPADRADLRIIGAVAQKFTTLRPDDPRTALLTATYLNNRRTDGMQPRTTEIEVPSTGLFDIARYDNNGKEQRLSDVAAKSRLTVLSFTSYGMENSAAYNVLLNNIHSRFASSGLSIYQVAFDRDEVSWRASAANLPWITVWNAPTDGTDPLLRYNVGAFPATFIIDSNGDVVERIADPARLESAVARYF